MDITNEELSVLLPRTDAAALLLRMPAEERLPKYERNSLEVGEDCPLEVKEFIRRQGMPNT
jgi:hypothetical protein